MAKTWHEKLHNGKKPVSKRLEKAFWGMEVGDLMLVSTPESVDAYIRNIPQGKTVEVKKMRADLAKAAGADHTCPVSTGIFLRIVSEAAYEDLQQGKDEADVTPFWRVVEPDSDLAKKLACGVEFLVDKRQAESTAA